MVTPTSTERIVRQFVDDNLLYGDASRLVDNDASLLNAGIIDSTGVLQLVTFLEQEFSIKVEDQEVVPANMDSISRLVRFVHSKQSSNGNGDGHAV